MLRYDWVQTTDTRVPREIRLHADDVGSQSRQKRARNTGGAGLGLSICKAIVDGSGGEISINSRLGQGTCVTVRLPLVASASAVRELSTVS